MAQLKINYGIDLGTTNSAIARMENGVPTIKKIEVTDDTMPSCVFFQKNKSLRVGKQAYNSMKSDKRKAAKKGRKEEANTYIEFKRTMGTNTSYKSTHMGDSFSSEQLSSEVLKALKSYIADEDFRSVVITVPAKFTVNQKTATLEAAKLAGFNHIELLQEPIAAAMAYGLNSSQKDAYWLVFDFGGGTFDAALMKVEDGIIQVLDTEGVNYLGGKDLDFAIVDKILIPYLQGNYDIDEYLEDENRKEILRDALKTWAEEVKNQLSFNTEYSLYVDAGDFGEDASGEEMEIDLLITQQDLYKAIQPIFQKAVDICKNIIKRNNLSKEQLAKIILVGGPTHSPLIRRMLKEQVSENVDSSIDPITAVAIGASLYASTIDNEVNEELKNKDWLNSLKCEGKDVSEIKEQLESVEQEHVNSSESKISMQNLKEIHHKIEDSIDEIKVNDVDLKLHSRLKIIENIKNNFSLISEPLPLEIHKLDNHLITIRLTSEKYKNITGCVIRSDKMWISDFIELNHLGDVIELMTTNSEEKCFEILCFDNNNLRYNAKPSLISLK
ncbi:MAG: Hsp70 family protein [Muribaculaceae bacterium]|nr:Hsp70 family protein [Muribaculaceae bacterium]